MVCMEHIYLFFYSVVSNALFAFKQDRDVLSRPYLSVFNYLCASQENTILPFYLFTGYF